MTTEVTMTATMDGNEQAFAVLADLIAKRQQYLKGETTENAVIATAINVVTSIKTDTRTAPSRPKDAMYKVEQVGGHTAGWRGRPARRKAIAGGHAIASLRPVNLMYGLKGDGDLYKITLTNVPTTPQQSLNAPYYYVLAPNLKVAVDYAKSRVQRVLNKERGSAKYALGIAQAKVSDRAMTATPPTGSHAMQVAFDAVNVDKHGGDGTFSLHVLDALDYSALALKSGDASLTNALMKAANKTASILNRLAGASLTEEISTPFPEVTQRK